MSNSVNKLAYFCNEVIDGAAYGKYLMFIEDRPVFYVFVSADIKNDEGYFPIFISKAEDGAPLQSTAGYCGWDEENGHVEGQHIQQFIYPRLPLLLADLFVPKA